MRNIIVLLLLGALLAGCTKSSGSADEKITITGSDTMVILNQQWAEKYIEKYPGAKVSVSGGGSGVGITALIEDKVDIAASSREMKEAEVQKARDNGVDPVRTTVAHDGIAIVVNSKNTVSELTMAQLKGIFTGNITNWNEVGGPDEPISVYSRESSSGTYEFFKEHVLEKMDYTGAARFLSGNSVIAEAVSQDSQGIGYIGVGYANQRDDIKIVPIKKDGNSQAYYPDKGNVLSKKYPIARELYLYTDGQPEGSVKDFMDFALSEEGQGIVEDVGYFRIGG